MPRLTSAQLTAFKNDLAANTNTVVVGGTTFAINSNDVLPTDHSEPSNEAAQKVAEWYNAVASPDWWAWRSDVRRLDVYTAQPPEATAWGWVGFKNQGVAEQNAWFEMFMGSTCNFGNANNRLGVLDIFGTAGAGGANRTHIFNVVRKLAKRSEKLFSSPITNAPANTGNDNVVGNQGKTTNPCVLGNDANGAPIVSVTPQDVKDAWTS